MSLDESVRWSFAALGAAFAILWRDLAGVMFAYLLLALLDTFTAVVANGKRKNISPEQGAYGWKKKANNIAIVLVIAVLQQGLPPGFLEQWGYQSIPAAQTVCGVLAIWEALSALRNWAYTNPSAAKLAERFGPGIPEGPVNPPEGLIGLFGKPKWADVDRREGGE
ncbi:MAG: phage holin family protein [Chloroflexota bacterium]|jgi:hypothetical protein